MPHDVLTKLGATTDSDGATSVLHYRIDERLGEGGMGVVFAGFDQKLQRDVAIKVLKPEIGEVTDSRSRFVAEARALAAVEHDHVVKIHAVEEHNGLPFIVMERLNGRPLSQHLKRETKLPAITAIRIAANRQRPARRAWAEDSSSRHQAAEHLARRGNSASQAVGLWSG